MKTHFGNLEAVIFDMDGTLIEHTWKAEQLTQALYDKFAPELEPISKEIFFEEYFSRSVDLWYMMVDGVIDGDIAQLYGYRNTLRSLNLDDTLAYQMKNAWHELVLEEAQPFADTYTVLETIRPHFKTAIITNGFNSLQQAKLQKYRLCDYVDACFISEQVGFHKPDTRIFYHALKHFENISPQAALYVGDSPESDIKGATTAGFHAVLITKREKSYIPPSDVPTIRTLSDLLPYLFQ